MSKVLLVSNCATLGLARSLETRCPSLNVTSYPIHKASTKRKRFFADCEEHDALILLSDVRTQFSGLDDFESKIQYVPNFYFSGYHPDTCFVLDENQNRVTTDFGTNHSIICFVGYRLGLAEQETFSLFNEKTFEAVGYFNEWALSKRAITHNFQKADLAISGFFPKWSKTGCFMHTVNHPSTRCLFDISGLIAEKLGVEVDSNYYVPPDYLGNASIYPCYPDIAAANGCVGSYSFKLARTDHVINLRQFVHMCYETYAGFPVGTLSLHKAYEGKARMVRHYLEGSRGA